MALLPQCGTAEDAIHFSEVWNLLIHKRTANRIFSTTFSIFFFYQKYIHTHIFPQTGVDLNPTRFLILIGCHKVNRKTQKWYLFIQHAHLIFLTAFQPFHQLTLSFGSAHVQKEILWTTYCRAIGSSTFFILLADLLLLNIIGNATFIGNHRYRLPFRLDRHDLLHIHQLQHPNVAVIAFYNPVGIPVQKARLYFTIRKRGIIAECSLDAVHI